MCIGPVTEASLAALELKAGRDFYGLGKCIGIPTSQEGEEGKVRRPRVLEMRVAGAIWKTYVNSGLC